MTEERRQDPHRATARGLTSIGGKVGSLVAALIAILLLSNGLLLAQSVATANRYDSLLRHEVAQALTARRMQVEFKKQVQEWKDILLRGANPTDRATYTANFEKQFGLVNQLADQLSSSVTDPQAAKDVATFKDAHATLQANYEKALAGFVAGSGLDFHAADTAVRGQDRPPTALVDQVVARMQVLVDADVTTRKEAAAREQRLIAIGGLAATILLVVLLWIVVRRIVRPVRRLTEAARDAAQVSLPAAVAQIMATPGSEVVRPSLPAFPVETGDELAALSSALTAMQDRAVDLALEQHRTDRETAEMLLNLGRRNQTLLARVLSYISALERTESDPDVVAELFRIDHATTRIRRNAASMLVLAGAAPAPSRARAIGAADIVRAALSEIEDYIRVDLYHLEDVAVVGGAASDLTHLLAELLENATHFSPPTTRIAVVGQRVSGGYRMRVIDQGIGMTREELQVANERITHAAQGRSDARLLGLYVVGRLAARHAISVTLEASAGLGITATVLVPEAALTSAAPAAQTAPTEPAAQATPVVQTSVPQQVESARTIDLREPVAVTGHRDAVAWGGEPPTSVPTRVRGSHLAQLGFMDEDAASPAASPAAFAVAPDVSSSRLRSFQLDVEAARRKVREGRDPLREAAGGRESSPAEPGERQGDPNHERLEGWPTHQHGSWAAPGTSTEEQS